MSQLQKNLQFLIDKFKTNPNALSIETKVPQPTIHRILSGASEDPRTGTLKPLADYFGYTVEALRSMDIEGSDVIADKAVRDGPPAHPHVAEPPAMFHINFSKKSPCPFKRASG